MGDHALAGPPPIFDNGTAVHEIGVPDEDVPGFADAIYSAITGWMSHMGQYSPEIWRARWH